jgi:acetyltransferase-like isoleucine patch superfamily enzyme
MCEHRGNSTAAVASDASLGEHVVLGHHVVIESGVTIGRNVRIGHHSVILQDTVIGDDVVVGSGSVLGCQPYTNSKVLHSVSRQASLIVGSRSRIGSGAVIYAGTRLGDDVLVGDLATIRERTFIGSSTVVGRSAKVECRTVVGSGVVIQTGAYITADMIIEDHVFIGPEVSTSNDKYMEPTQVALRGPHIKQGARIGNNATLLPGIVIGRHAVVGAGSVVTRDIPDGVTAVGVPAKWSRKGQV